MNIVNKTPLIGIMTARKASGEITGNGPLFIEIQKKLISLNGISFIFTLEGVEDDCIHGYIFSPDENRWIKEKFPFPDLVYNRIPFRKLERDEQCQHFFSLLKIKRIPFFNPCFIDKYELYDLFKDHSIVQHFLPETILVQTKGDLYSFLKKHNRIYLKPRLASKGKGIFRLKNINSTEIELEGLEITETYHSFQHFWEEWSKELSNQKYIAQEEILSAKFQGARFDFRILAHAIDDDYAITGIGIRQSQTQHLTTHIPAGGRMLPYKQVQSNDHDNFIQMIVPHIGSALSEQYGFFGEFSIDAGVSNTGQYYIFEVNSKPMSFDETEIEEKKITELCRLFFQLTNTEKNI
ncbi:YheC/YheD family protein [Neobacillus pocheonensis]|uniref:YheC/YheD family endospore coat-associated protein n=1 Tax=Neobacillus pocheonensis TaxID=363869 RepID=UPI003D28BECC